MDKLKTLYDAACAAYNSSNPHFEKCREVVAYCQQKLKQSVFEAYGDFSGKPKVSYSVFRAESSISRPVRPDLFLASNEEFSVQLERILKIAKNSSHAWTMDDHVRANQVVYTAIMAFACCYDLWKPSSRKTPGTFFEVFMAGLIRSVFTDTETALSKHISLTEILAASKVGHDLEQEIEDERTAVSDEDEESSVSTDVVISIPGRKGGIVLPLKITTRERIVQPFAHQRILDAAFGAGIYRSLIVCISETQLAKKTKKVNQICVPGTVKLFQRFLAPVSGMYYCDVPQRYAKEDVTKSIGVKSMGHLFGDLRLMLQSLKEQAQVD